ncbi:MAG TPA: molybdopterin cofactor-binding domain-containing protein [Thermoanaerobaculia bacterium]|jgi:4-hydroxybenzoyl-CoA reductase subunit alpha|nr:molybdopterin cofactor-binding domain-containing protein [Thermoanaerobaculia bacterium]
MAEPIRKPEPEPEFRPEFNIVGKPFRRVDGRAKVTGNTKFADDLTFPRMAAMRLVRSTVPHALIKSIDLSEAEKVSGVLGFLTGKDFPVPFGILPVSQDEHALCPDKVRFVGDPVVAVAAVTEDAAWEAAYKVKIEYEPLTTIGSVQEALETAEPRIHDYGDHGNVHKSVSMAFGDLDGGFAEADEIFEDTVFYEGNTHLPMEQHAAVAVPEDDDRITVYSSSQTPHYVHRAVAKVLELPASRVRVVACSNGGGFGGKSDPFNHEIVAAKMALKLGRPVKITLTREEVFYCHRGRHPVLMHVRTGLKKDGGRWKITAQHLKTALDGGAYGSYGVASTYYTGALQTVTYELPAYRFDGVRAFTNKPPCGPKRGHGTPQPRFAFEIHLDKIAVKLGVNPADLRLGMLAQPGTVTANWLRIGSMGLRRCIEAVVEGSGFRERWGRMPEGRGLGLACGSYLCGAGLPIYWNHMPQSGVMLKLDRSGGVAVFCGESEIGQGSDSILAAMVAEVLGISLADIRLCVADTDLTPVDLGSYSSRVTLMMGNAAVQAAERAREMITKAVSEQLEIPAARLVFADRRVFDAQDPDKGISFQEAVIATEARFGTLATAGSYIPPRSPGKYRGAGVGPSPAYSYSAAVIEVEVDPETGLWSPVHVWMAHDIGRSLNPVLVMGQVEGSVYMGLGEVMMEEQAFRRLPKHLSNALVHKFPSMLEYKSPTFLEMPPVTTYLIEDPDPEGPFGAKEVGQGPLLPVMPAVVNAIHDAVGVRIDQCPVHPHMILKALQAKAKGKEPRVGPKTFPEVDFEETLLVPTPAQGGDGRAINDYKDKLRSGMRSASGTMMSREEALKQKKIAVLTTGPEGAK